MGWGLPIWPPKQWSRTGCLPSQGWMWLAAENKVDMVLLWEDWEWWFIPSFCTKQLQQNLRFTFSRNHPPTKRTYIERHHCLERTLSVSQCLNLTSCYCDHWNESNWPWSSIFFNQKGSILYSSCEAFGCQLSSSKPSSHYRHQQHKHRGVQAIYRVRWRWPTFALGGCLGKLSVGLFNRPLHHLNLHSHHHCRCWTWW